MTAVLLLLNSMDCNIVEEIGKGINAFIERYSPLIVNPAPGDLPEYYPNLCRLR